MDDMMEDVASPSSQNTKSIPMPDLSYKIISPENLENQYGEGTDDLCNDHEQLIE